MTTTKHIHHDVIIEWAKGATIQCRINDDDTWDIVNPPLWKTQYQYRVKPAPEKYRVALMALRSTGKLYTITADASDMESYLNTHKEFKRWLTDWVEYEV